MKFKYIENKKRFRDEKKIIFHHSKVISVVEICLRPESVPLSWSCLSVRPLTKVNVRGERGELEFWNFGFLKEVKVFLILGSGVVV